MIIYRGNTEILNLTFNPDGIESRELMVEHSVSFKFELSEYLSLNKGDKITHNGKDFYLNKDYIPTINKSTNGFKYDLKFYDITERFKDFKLKYLLQGVDELEFKLTGSGDKFLDTVIYSLSKHNLGTFTKGQYPTDIKEIHFENKDIFEGLNLIAETYGLEWWIDGSTLNLGTLEFGTPVLLRYDIELDDISFSPSSEKLITRLYAFGSTRNIPNDYRASGSPVDNIAERRLRLPQGTDYVDLFPSLPDNQIIEGVKIFDDIYPRQRNIITEVTTSMIGQTTTYTIKGNNTFTITQDDVTPGQPLKIAFVTGFLAGREFELIIRENNKFEIKYEQNGSVYLPNPTLKPQAGDEFFFFNFKAETVLPTLITDAENELLDESQDFIDKIGAEYVYTVKTRSIYCENNLIDWEIGQIVTLQSDTIGSVTSRIRGYEKDLYNKYECTYTVGNYSRYSRIGTIERSALRKADKSDVGQLESKVDNVRNEISGMSSKFLSKVNPDTATEVITFLKGIIAVGTSEFVNLIASGKITTADFESGTANVTGTLTAKDIISDTLKTQILQALVRAELQDVILKGQLNSETFVSGFLGEGFRLKKDNDRWVLEIDDLVVRKTMQIYELIVQRVRYQGGQVLHSPAGGKITAVTDGGTYWRCEHDSPDDFITDAQVLCQTFKVGSKKENPDGTTTFGGASVKRYWRKVTSYGPGWFNLSKTDMEAGSGTPEVGDEIAVLGHKTNVDWQNAIMIASTGTNTPYIAHYAGINTYSTAGKEVIIEGNLSGIVDAVFGQLSGYGLYTKNAFLRGIFKLVNGTDVGQKLAEHDTTFLSTASKTEVSTAKSEAISTAASDATSKANTAQTNATNAAKGYTDGQVSPLVTRITSAETAISQNADAISLRATREEVNAIQIGGENLLVGSAARIPVFNQNTTGSGVRSTVKEESGEQYYTYTPNAGVNLSLYGAGFTYEAAKEYIAGIFIRHSHTANINVSIYMNVGNPLGSKTTSIPPNIWTYITTNPYKKATDGVGYLVVTSGNSVAVDIKKAKIEYGNKPTTWSVNTDSAEKRVTTVEGTLTVQAGLIAAKASQADVTALGVRMDSAELKITPTAITQTVRSSAEYDADRTTDLDAAATDATNKVNSIQIGGRNLFSLSNGISAWRIDTGATTYIFDRVVGGFKYTAAQTSNIRVQFSNPEGGWITVGFWISSTVANHPITVDISDSTPSKSMETSATPNTRTRFELTVNVTNSYRFVDIVVIGNGGTVNISELKIEVGTKATAWENIADRFSGAESRLLSAESSITQNADNIALRVTKQELISSIGGGVNLSGLISAYALGSGWTRSGETLSNLTTSLYNHCSSPNFSLTAGKVYILSAYVEQIEGSGVISIVNTSTGVTMVAMAVVSYGNIRTFTCTATATYHIRVYGNTSTKYVVRDIRVELSPQERVANTETSINQTDSRITLAAQRITSELGGTITGTDVSTISITPTQIALKIAAGANIGTRNYWYPNSASIVKTATTAAWSVANRTLLNIIPNGKEITIEFDVVSSATVNVILYKSPKTTIAWDGTSYIQALNFTATTTKTRQRATFTFDETRPFMVFYKNSAASVAITFEKIMLVEGNMAAVWEEAPEVFDSKLLATGIDIENKKIILTSDLVEFRSNTGGVTNKTKILIDGSIEAIDGKFTGTVTATSGEIGGFTIQANGLVNKASNTRILFDGVDGGQSFIRINESVSSPLISIRTDVANRSGISISTYASNAMGLEIVANVGSKYAIKSSGGHQFYQRGGEIWTAPGIIMAAVINSSSVSYQWAVSGVDKQVAFNNLNPGFSAVFTHNLGHTDYVLGISLGGSNAYSRIIYQGSSYFTIAIYGLGLNDSVFVQMFGRNKYYG